MSGRARVSAALWRRAWLRATLTLTPAAGVVPRDLPRVARGDADHGVLERQPVHQHPRPQLTLANFRQLFTATYLTIIGRTVGHGGAGDGHRRRSSRSRSPTSWRGSRPRAGGRLLFIGRAAAAVGELPRPRLRLDRDPQKGGTLDWTLPSSGLGAAEHRLHEHRDVARVLLHLAAVHDHARLRRARADPGLAARGLRRPRRAQLAHDRAASCCRWRCRASSPGRSSPSRSRSATSSRRC